MQRDDGDSDRDRRLRWTSRLGPWEHSLSRPLAACSLLFLTSPCQSFCRALEHYCSILVISSALILVDLESWATREATVLVLQECWILAHGCCLCGSTSCLRFDGAIWDDFAAIVSLVTFRGRSSLDRCGRAAIHAGSFVVWLAHVGLSARADFRRLAQDGRTVKRQK